MTPGWVAVSGALSGGSWSAVLTWEPAEVRTMKKRWRDIGKRGTVVLLAGRYIARKERAASLCHERGSVVFDPDPR